MKRSSGLIGALILASLIAPMSVHAAEQRAGITIEYDDELDRAHGVRSGSGTPKDPYVISGWTLESLRIKDTTKAIRITGNTITGRLTLDYVGPHITVDRNRIGDLRVNQNVGRWGSSTRGLFTRNTIGVVGQLRHFEGVFSWNTVGSSEPDATGAYPATRAVAVDGWNNARIVNNKIYGYLDARLHGHHHASEFGATSHAHGGAGGSRGKDHAVRFHQVWIEANSIFTSHAYGLAYLDDKHAADDRTATSDPDPALNAPHSHHTRAIIRSNAIEGAGLLVNVFNSTDGRHVGTHSGRLEIDRNRVTLTRNIAQPFAVTHGIEVRQARHLTAVLRENTVTGAEPLTGVPHLDAQLQRGAGIFLNVLDHATVSVEKATIANRQFGVQAKDLSKTVRWSVTALATSNVSEDVGYDASVANAPARR